MLRARGIIGIAGAVALVAAASTAIAGQQAATAGQGYKVVGKWGKIGTSGNGVFASGVSGVAVDGAGNVYAADTDNNRVQVFTPKGAFIRKWGSQGDGNGQFSRAEDVDVAPDGTVWVADEGNERVQQFSASGAYMTTIQLPFGTGARGLAVESSDSVLVAVETSSSSGFVRYIKKPTGWEAATGIVGSLDTHRADDVEVSPDGTIYLVRTAVQFSDDRVQRFSADDKLLGAFKLGPGDARRGIGVDLDCNVWAADSPNRRIVKHSPSGKALATAAVPDLISNDIDVAPNGDIYVFHQNTGMVHFAENKAKPATANVPRAIKVVKGKATVKYTASGFACPAQVDGTATLKGPGVSGRAAVKIAAGKKTPIEMTVHGPAGKTVKATFTIVLETNGRPTTETKAVVVAFAR